MFSLLTVTGAAWNLFFVNTAAAEQGLSEAMRARSSKDLLDGFTPTWVPLARKPCGYIPDEGTYFALAGGIDPSPGAEYCRTCWAIGLVRRLRALRVDVDRDITLGFKRQAENAKQYGVVVGQFTERRDARVLYILYQRAKS